MRGLDLSENGDHATLSVGNIVTAATNPTITVKLTVTGNHDATDTTTRTITVLANKPPTAAVIGWSQVGRAYLYPAAFDLDDTDLSDKWRVTDAGTLSTLDINWSTSSNGQLTTLTLDQNATDPGKNLHDHRRTHCHRPPRSVRLNHRNRRAHRKSTGGTTGQLWWFEPAQSPQRHRPHTTRPVPPSRPHGPPVPALDQQHPTTWPAPSNNG